MAHRNRNTPKEEIGGTSYCFGEFRCGFCNGCWESSKAWKYFGQECEKCYNKVKPHTVHELFYYCCIKCVRVWKYKWIDEGSNCSKCKEVKLPRTYEQFSVYWLPLQLSTKVKGVIDPTKHHKMELCECCRKLGTLCYTSNRLPNKSAPVLIHGKLANVLKIKQFPVPVQARQFIPDKPHLPGKQPISYRDAARIGALTISTENMNKSNIEIRNQPSRNIRARQDSAITPDYLCNNAQPKLTSTNGPKRSDFEDSLPKESFATNRHDVRECSRPTYGPPGNRNSRQEPMSPIELLFVILLLIIAFLFSQFSVENKKY